MVKLLLERICKRFRNTEKRDNFDLKPDQQMKKSLSKKRRNYIHKYKEVKEKLYPISFIYVRTKLKHQVQDMNASQKVQFFLNVRRPETHFLHQQDH